MSDFKQRVTYFHDLDVGNFYYGEGTPPHFHPSSLPPLLVFFSLVLTITTKKKKLIG